MNIATLFKNTELVELLKNEGFEKQKSDKTAYVFMNEAGFFITFSYPRWRNSYINFDSTILDAFDIELKNYKREWAVNEIQQLILFLKEDFLPSIKNVKGPYNLPPQDYFRVVNNCVQKRIQIEAHIDNGKIEIPFNDTLVAFQLNYLEYKLTENVELLFIAKLKTYSILIQNGTKELLHWSFFGDKYKEGEELVVEIVDNVFKYLKEKYGIDI